MRQLLFLFLVSLISVTPPATARLTIEITGGVEGAQPIAIVPFGLSETASPVVDIAAVITADLTRTGRFAPLAARDLTSQPHRESEVEFRHWQSLNANNLVIGRIQPDGEGYLVEYALFDVFGNKKLLDGRQRSTAQGLRLTAHRIADAIYEKLTGEPGVFSTRIAYVTSVGRGTPNERITLRVADADGHNPQTIVESSEPIMSPAWSPDGRRLAYVSFEGRRHSIFIQELASGRRERVASFPGINGSPAFAPDGQRLAMTLSKDGNPEIYVLHLSTGELRRITNHQAIDTEPVFSSDGQRLFFTSDRTGRPQLYQVPASGGEAQRLTFEGSYNAAADVAPNGRALAFVTLANGRYHIATIDASGRGMRLLSRGGLDESPSFAANGSMVIYATQHQGRGVLAVTPIAGGSGQRLSQDVGEVREPAWSPLIR